MVEFLQLITKKCLALAIGLSILVGCKSGTSIDNNDTPLQDTVQSVAIPVETNNEIGDEGMKIPKELLEPKPVVSYNPPDISFTQSYKDTFQVSNPKELFAALGSDRVLMIQDGIYKLDKRLLINNYQHIKLEGVGKPTIQFVDPMLTSIMVYGSSSVWISNIILDIGFPASEVCGKDQCMRSMITMRKTNDVILDYITMLNTPISRFNTDETTNVMIYEMHIENSYGFNIDLYNSDNIQIQFCSFKNLKTGDTAFSSYAPNLESHRVYFDNVEISNVVAESGDERGPVLFNSSPVLRKCTITNAPGLSLGIDEKYFIDCTISL